MRLMYNLEYPTNANGVPIVSGDDLDAFGERLISDFSLGTLFSPSEIDIDRFATKYLMMRQDYFFLSHCGVYLGMTVFRDTNSIPIYVPEENKADYASAKARTMVIDSSLLGDGQEHRYRFTVGHESGHGILHTPYFLNVIGNQQSNGSSEFIRCRADGYRSNNNMPYYQWTDSMRVEWQANRLSSALLMPKCTVKILLARNSNKGSAGWYSYAMSALSKTFNVSVESAFYRLKDLGYIDKDIPFVAVI